MKRFTETNKWRDPWFRRLSSPAKQLWGYLCDNCDAIGLVELDLGLASADCGQPITEAHVAELGARVQLVGEGRYFLPKFIPFQYGKLSEACPAHKNVIRLAEQHHLELNSLSLAYSYPSSSNRRVALPYRTGEREDQDQDQDQGKGGAGGNGSGEVDLPPGFPKTAEAAVQASGMVGATEQLIYKTWNAAMSRGGRDAKGQPIVSWAHYLSAAKSFDQERIAAANRPRQVQPPPPPPKTKFTNSSIIPT